MTEEMIYQIFPDRFYSENPLAVEKWGGKVDRECFKGGDIQGIIKKLEYIKDLGMTAIYLNPIFQSPSNHKYDTEEYYKIDERFGVLEDFKELIKNCHEKNIKVIIDGVFNHTSTEFFAFKDILKNQDSSKYKDWYEIYRYPVTVKDPPDYRACGGAAFLPKLNTKNEAVQNYIIQVIKYWESFGIDGIRLDVPFEIHESLLEKIRSYTKLYIVGEIWGYGGQYVPKYFHGVTNYLLRDLVKKAVVNQCIDAKMFQYEWENIERMYSKHIYNCVNLAGSHDTERIYTLCSENVDKVNLFFAFLFLLPGIPLVYYGDEIGMEGGNDPYCRGCMIWEEDKWNRQVLDNIKYLASMRKNIAALRRGKVNFISCEDRMIVFERVCENSTATVYVNFGFQNYSIDQFILRPLSYKVIHNETSSKKYKNLEEKN